MNTVAGEHRSLRWCPTTEQVAILEGLFSGGLRNPSPSQIHQLVDHLSQYGKVQGRNVFYWFQNHKAREKQKIRQQLWRQHQEELESLYNNTFGEKVMVPDQGCFFSQQSGGVASCVPCHAPYSNVFFSQGATSAISTCCEPVSAMENMLETVNHGLESPYQHHPLALPTLELFPATNSVQSSKRHNAQ